MIFSIKYGKTILQDLQTQPDRYFLEERKEEKDKVQIPNSAPFSV